MDMSTFGAFVLFGLLVMPLSVAVFAVFGIAWAPIAAAVCWAIARSKKFDVWRYAFIGALYSVLLFFPWLYLVARMYDQTIPRALIRFVYGLLYVCWIYVIIVVLVMFLSESSSNAAFENAVFFILIVANLLVCIYSLLRIKSPF